MEDAAARSGSVGNVAYILEFELDGVADEYTRRIWTTFELTDGRAGLTVNFAGGTVASVRVNGSLVVAPYNGYLLTLPASSLRTGVECSRNPSRTIRNTGSFQPARASKMGGSSIYLSSRPRRRPGQPSVPIARNSVSTTSTRGSHRPARARDLRWRPNRSRGRGRSALSRFWRMRTMATGTTRGSTSVARNWPFLATNSVPSLIH